MFRTLILGALALALASCATPNDFRMQGGMSNSDAAALSKMIGGFK